MFRALRKHHDIRRMRDEPFVDAVLGKRRFLDYINVLESVVADALKVTEPSSSPASPLAEGWSPA